MRIVLGQSAAIPSPPFVNLDEERAAPAETPTVEVSSWMRGGLADAAVEPVSGGVGRYRAVLPADPYTAEVDVLELTWSVQVDGHTSTYRQTVEVVTGHYASIPELRAHPDLGDTTRVPTDRLRAWRDGFASLVERARGASWVGRLDAVESYHGAPVRLPRDTTNVLTVEIDGAPYLFDGWTRSETGLLYVAGNASLIPAALTVRVVIARGWAEPPECLRAACREYVREACMAPASGVARNAITWGDGNGGTYRIGTANWNAGRYTGLNTVDRLINEATDYRLGVGIG